MIDLYHMYNIFDFTIDYYSSKWALASIDFLYIALHQHLIVIYILISPTLFSPPTILSTTT